MLDTLTDEELGKDLGSSFPNVADTLVHTMGAEWVWLQRWLGHSPTSFPDVASLTFVAAVRARWDVLWAEQQAFLASLDVASLRRPVAYKGFDGAPFEQPLHQLIRHVVNHATYHRGQLATMLRQLGKKPPSTDLVRVLSRVRRAFVTCRGGSSDPPARGRMNVARNDWFADESFWEELYPFLFSAERRAAAPGEIDAVLALIDDRPATLLDLCCGPGRHSVACAKRGIAVTGVDRSAFLLDKASAYAESGEHARRMGARGHARVRYGPRAST